MDIKHKQLTDDELHADVGYERRDVNLLVITILALACIVLVAGFAVGLNEYFLMTKESLERERYAPPQELQDVRAGAEKKLTEYGVVDAEKGIYHMPVEQAMKKLADQQTSP